MCKITNAASWGWVQGLHFYINVTNLIFVRLDWMYPIISTRIQHFIQQQPDDGYIPSSKGVPSGLQKRKRKRERSKYNHFVMIIFMKLHLDIMRPYKSKLTDAPDKKKKSSQELKSVV